MILLKNCGPEELKKRIKEKKIFFYGAGRTLESGLERYCSDLSVEAIIDKDSLKWNTYVKNNNEKIPITSLDSLISDVKKYGKDNIVLLITSQFYAADIIEELDCIKELDGLTCYSLFLVRNTREELHKFEFTVGTQLIPKKLHYIWLGGKELPGEFKRNLETWKKFNPDYEIIRWDESNYDLNKNDFIKEAYASEKWSKVANYARMDILYQYGGIYMDTDVEVLKSLDCLLNDECFFCLGNQDSVNNGCGLGAVKGHFIIKEIMEEFEGKHFDTQKGGFGMRSAHNFMNPAVKRYGFKLENRYQRIGGVVLYPKEVMSPLTFGDLEDFFCERTLSIHYEAGSWKTNSEKDGVKKLNDIIRERL